MKLGYFAAIALFTATVAAAQDAKTRTNVTVKDGKEITLTGCVERNPNGEYVLTNVAGKDGAVGSYILAKGGDSDALEDLDKHVGHRMEIVGKAANRGDGKIEVETKSENKRGKTETKSEVKGDLDGLPFLGVKSSRMIASVCP
jgi:acylphosphatase